jgi:hypothetical protein
MQTFLPYKSLHESVKCLDYKRLGKQRVEAKQLLKSIYISNYRWSSHPCSKMWRDYPNALAYYYNLCIDEWVSRGYNNTMLKINVDTESIRFPSWLGDDRLHDSHKSNLLFKDRLFYSKYGWNVDRHLAYYWCGFGSTDLDIYGE